MRLGIKSMVSRRSHPAQYGETFDWSANLIAQRFRAPEGGYILPFSRREGLVRMWSSPCRRDGEVEKSSKGRRRDSKNISFSKYSFVSIILIFKNSDAKVKALCIKALCRNGDMLISSFSTPPHRLSPPRSRSRLRRASCRGRSSPYHRQRDGG